MSSWPQIVMLILMLWGLFGGLAKSFEKARLWREFYVSVAVYLAVYAGYWYVLRAGGFW